MNDDRRDYLLSLKVDKIDPNGEYYHFSKNPDATLLYQKKRLTDQDIIFLRNYYHDKTIAINRVQPVRQATFVLDKDRNKYNRGLRMRKKPIITGKRIIIGGLVVLLVWGGHKLLEPKADVIVDTATVEYTEPAYEDETEDFSFVEDNEARRIEVIKHLCNIYQVNYDVVYNTLKELTNNFSSEDYLNGHINGISCKGFEVNATSEDELLMYAVRVIKQAPERLGMSTTNLYINNGYDSGTDYFKMISDICEVLGINRDLMYAIVNSETSFNSDLFLNVNNPAGLRCVDGTSTWWEFANKEEGFIEFGMELIKYYNKLGLDKTDISSEAIAMIGSIHAPVSDGNDRWLPNVLESLEYAQSHEEELFGGTEVHGLGR